jgi:hypothetical protein
MAAKCLPAPFESRRSAVQFQKYRKKELVSTVVPDLEETRKRDFSGLRLFCHPNTAAGSVRSRTPRSSPAEEVLNTLARTYGARLDPPMPRSRAFVTPFFRIRRA